MSKIVMTAIIVVLSFTSIYLIAGAVSLFFFNYLKEPKEKTNSPPSNPFNKPIFKIPLGLLIISGTLVYTINLVKVLPPIMKVGIIGLDFIVIYLVINYLFINKKTKK
jgi:hypothetical protein